MKKENVFSLHVPRKWNTRCPFGPCLSFESCSKLISLDQPSPGPSEFLTPVRITSHPPNQSPSTPTRGSSGSGVPVSTESSVSRSCGLGVRDSVVRVITDRLRPGNRPLQRKSCGNWTVLTAFDSPRWVRGCENRWSQIELDQLRPHAISVDIHYPPRW